MTSTDMLKLAVSVRQHLWKLQIFFKEYFKCWQSASFRAPAIAKLGKWMV